MRKLIATIALPSALVLTASAFAGVTKFTLNDVTYPDGTTGEIEAGVKDTNKSDLTNCAYFSYDYPDALGYYSAPVVFATAEEAREFCLDHFDERQTQLRRTLGPHPGGRDPRPGRWRWLSSGDGLRAVGGAR